MAEKTLSIFIDESGTYGNCESYEDKYVVGLVFHDQSIDISSNIANFMSHLEMLGARGRSEKAERGKNLSPFLWFPVGWLFFLDVQPVVQLVIGIRKLDPVRPVRDHIVIAVQVPEDYVGNPGGQRHRTRGGFDMENLNVDL